MSDLDKVILEAKKDNDKYRIFTFGLGNGCDVNLVQKMAWAGRGSCSLVRDGAADLNSQVIRSLQDAMEPSLKGCRYKWNEASVRSWGEVFRNELIIETCIMTKEQFADMSFKFVCQEDRMTKAILVLDTKNDHIISKKENPRSKNAEIGSQKTARLLVFDVYVSKLKVVKNKKEMYHF